MIKFVDDLRIYEGGAVMAVGGEFINGDESV
jgi:hypothetical protein